MMSSGRKHHHDPDKSVANGDAKLLKKRQSGGGGGEGCGFEGNFFMDFYFSQGDYKDEANKTAKEEKIAKQHREDEAATGLDADRKRAKKTVLEKAEEGIQEALADKSKHHHHHNNHHHEEGRKRQSQHKKNPHHHRKHH